MPIALVKEDGTGLANANTYASQADGDTYAEGRLNSTDWSTATSDNKNRALAQATLAIDSEYQFYGFKTTQAQALQWPRRECPDPDYTAAILPVGHFRPGSYLPSDEVPAAVVKATCEMAIQLLKGDRTGDVQGAGIKRVDIAGAVEVEFDHASATAATLLTRDVKNMLSKYGQPISGNRNVKVVRA